MSANIFITTIKLNDHPYIRPLSIQLPTDKKHPLIITGKNGTGKTTLLEQITLMLAGIANDGRDDISLAKRLDHYRIFSIDSLPAGDDPTSATRGFNDFHAQFGFILLEFNTDSYIKTIRRGEFILASFKAKRQAHITKPTAVAAPKAAKVELIPAAEQSASSQFLSYLVNRKSQQAFAIADGDSADNNSEVEEISQWFNRLDDYFSQLFETPLRFKFNRKQLEFTLLNENNQVIDLNLLSDGYSAIVHIFTDIIMRMEVNKFGDYNQHGIVLIDEIETHLHVSLQKSVLPLLMAFFPNIQFIVTTHSPFVLSSVTDAIIYDMERDQLINQQESLWQYSYEALVEGYFEVEKFAEVLKQKSSSIKH